LITETGIGDFLIKYKADFKRAKEQHEIQVVLHGEEKLYCRTIQKVEAILPKSPEKGYYCYRSVVYFDQELKLPIKMEFYDFKNTLIEIYGYKELKLNPGLTAKDFDAKNENYHF